MAATATEIDNYITDVRTAVTEFGNKLSIKQRLGHDDVYCDKIKLMLLSGYLDCIYDYFLQDDSTDPVNRYTANNFFTISEIRDVMQHINNLTDSNYILVNL
jgi:hypothetical protein